ncbi:MAG TPA: S8 family serine peptidase, partial [Caldilineae bacterium]|nr:S8 family serine peptidase [Caldilineae bacterium]
MNHQKQFLWQRPLRIFIPLLAVILLVAGLSFPWFTPASVASTASKLAIQPDWPYVQDHVLVQLRPGARLLRAQFPGARALFGDWMALPVPSGKSVIEAMNDLAQRDDVLRVQPDYIVQLDEPAPVRGPDLPRRSQSYPNDPLYSYQWHMPQVQSDTAWNMSRGANVVVAVVDTGVSRGSDLSCRTFVSPYDAITDTEGEYAARDQNGHGTHVAGAIGQCTDNNVGVVGLAPDVKIMPVRVLDANGSGSMSQVGAGIQWAADHGADVINMSLGMDCGGASYDSCHDAYVDSIISYAVSKDIVIVAASGNDGSSTPSYPANNPDVMAVAAVDYSRNRASYSNRGSALSVAAPGGDLNKDDNGDGYGDGVLQETFEGSLWGYYYFQGTSMASPHVAGAAALLRAYVPSASRTEVQEALEQTAMDLGSPGKDSDFGYGLIQVADALNYLQQQMPTSTPTPTPTSTTQPTSTPTPTP